MVNMTDNDAFLLIFPFFWWNWYILYFYVMYCILVFWRVQENCLLKVFVFLDLFQFILRKSLRSWHYLLFHPFFKSPLLTISVQFPLLLWCYMVRGQNYCLFFTKKYSYFLPSKRTTQHTKNWNDFFPGPKREKERVWHCGLTYLTLQIYFDCIDFRDMSRG